MQSESRAPIPPFVWPLVALVAFWLALANERHPVLRLTMAYENMIVYWLLLLLPWGAVVMAIVLLSGVRRWLMSIAALPALAAGFLPLLFTSVGVFSTPFGQSNGMLTALRRVSVPSAGALVVYQTDCGAPCGYGVLVRQERSLFPGLLLVRDVYSQYGAEDARIEITGRDGATIENEAVRLRRWVYW